jgi:hypothetical protein
MKSLEVIKSYAEEIMTETIPELFTVTSTSLKYLE